MFDRRGQRADEPGANDRPGQGMNSMLDDGLAERLRDAVDANFEDQIAFTADLVGSVANLT